MNSNNIIEENIIRHRRPRNRLLQNKRILITALVLLVLISTTILYINHDSQVMLVINGDPVAVVTEKEQVADTVRQIQDDLEQQYNMVLSCSDAKIEFDKEAVPKDAVPVEGKGLYALIKDKLDWQAEAWAICINNEPTLFLNSIENAQAALDGIKQYYLPKGENLGLNIEENEFAEKVAIKAGNCELEQLKTPEEAVEAMVKGLDTIVTHTVKSGDSLWTIAHTNDMTVSGLKEINPQLKSELLQPGQAINLVKSEPLLTVVATMKTTVNEKIAFKTVYENDGNLWRGQQQVKQKGEAGAREVTYRLTLENDHEVARETLAENVLKEPVSQIVRSGTKVMVASRGDGGSGVLSWPMRGRLTSLYGNRRGGFHTGLDIDGITGDPVYAAEAGVVLNAAWLGNLGRCVVIDHGDGLSTRYGHLSAFSVSIGQTVKRGDLIGKCGNTGRSTGSHLHFEVRVNGNHKNPLNYLD